MEERLEKQRRPLERRESIVRPGLDRREEQRRSSGERRAEDEPVHEDRRKGAERRKIDQRSGDERRTVADRRTIPERLNRVAAILLPPVLNARGARKLTESDELHPADFHDRRLRENLAKQLKGD